MPFLVITFEPVEKSCSTGALDGIGVLNSKKAFYSVGYNNNADNSFD